MRDTTNFRSIYSLPHSPEMQGVRAVAVTLVLIYHVNSALLPSGFVGVDIFFVLSGFLIGRKLLAELDETGTINSFAFSAARAKRLLPNALLALLVTAIASYFLLPAYRLEMIGQDIAAAAMIYSNFHFANNAIDYLEMGAPPSPVLHYWSLSIEEQFYIALPMLLWALSRIGGGRRVDLAVATVSAVAAVSFVLGLIALERSQPEAFFATQNRIWQLAAGVMVGWIVARHRRPLPPQLNSAIQLLAITLLLWSVFALDASTGYPGLAALAPTVGTSLILVSLFWGRRTIINRGLSSRAGRWIGDRSYSIYLWHWPFITIGTASVPDCKWMPWLAAASSIMMASAVYKYIEDPIRRTVNLAPRLALPAAATAVAAIAGAALLLVRAPLPVDAASRASAIAAARNDLGGAYETNCHLGLEAVDHPSCVFGDSAGTKSVLLFGDSHAAQWFDPLQMAAEEQGWRFTSRTKTSCPSSDVTIWYPGKSAIYSSCSVWRAEVMEEIKANPPDAIVLANFSNYRGWIAEDGKPAAARRAAELWRDGLRQLLSDIPDSTKIWVVRDNPRMATNYRDCLSYTDDCSRPRSEALDRLVDDAEMIGAIGRHVGLIDLTDQFCNSYVCPAIIEGQIVYRNDHHITSSFAKSLYNRFLVIFERG